MKIGSFTLSKLKIHECKFDQDLSPILIKLNLALLRPSD